MDHNSPHFTRIFRRHFLSFATLLSGLAISTPAAAAVKEWLITLEEPTGIYRREDEVVTARLSFEPGDAWKNRLQVLAPDGRPVIFQLEIDQTNPDGSIRSAELLFPASIVPGQRPEYRLVKTTGQSAAPPADQEVTARRLATGRIEMANDRFGVILNLGLENTEPAIVAAFNKSAADHRMLNLIDTSPDQEQRLPYGRPGSGVGTFLEGSERAGPFGDVRILESGPLRGRVRLTGSRLGGKAESWEFTWHRHSPVLHWSARLERDVPVVPYGFFFRSISAAPYVPFTRWIDGSEAVFPDGWETDNPPDHTIGPNNMEDLPGGHLLYYQREENYGALDIYELDKALTWKGVGSAQFRAYKTAGEAGQSMKLALAFPRWKGTESVLEARMEYRRFMQPVLAVVRPVAGGQVERIGGMPSPATGSAPVIEGMTAVPPSTSAGIPELDLNGDWRLQWAEKSEGEKAGFFLTDYADSDWRKVRVPGSVHTQVLKAPAFYTRDANWISQKEWWYRRAFRVPPGMSGKQLRIRFEATDYYADIWLNGALLGRHEGYTDPYELDVSREVRLEGENVLAVRVWTPVSYYWRHRPYTVKGAYGAVDQKPDDITALGITRPVRLLAYGAATIREIAVDTRINRDGSADVIADLDLGSGSSAVISPVIGLVLSPRNFAPADSIILAASLALPPEGLKRRFTLHVDRPHLWWTWDHGKPDLYNLEVEVKVDGILSDRRFQATGIREIEQIDWKFYLNGRRMFIRGTNSYYNLFQSEMLRGDYERDLGLMRAMNVNMIRLHCHFSNPEFYDLADELGILIWQDYLEAWYPEDKEFALKAAELYDPHIRYVRNHPSIAIWATCDEESLENYRMLTKHLEPRVYALDPQRRPVVRSTGRYGDAHVYHGWYEGSVWQYTSMTEKFVSELGATALPNYESLIRFLPDAWPIEDHSDDWIFHKLQIPEAMRAWGIPGSMSLREYVPQTQDYVARLFQLAIERARRLKYQPTGGILHFHAIDIWPSVTMAALDFWRQPTKAYSTVQRSFQPVLASFAYEKATWSKGERVKAELWLINDYWFDMPGLTITWSVENAKGETVHRGEMRKGVDLGADSSLKFENISFEAGPPGRYMLRARIVTRDGKSVSENLYEFRTE